MLSMPTSELYCHALFARNNFLHHPTDDYHHPSDDHHHPSDDYHHSDQLITLDVFTTLFVFIPMIFSSIFYLTSKSLKTHEYEKLLNTHEYELNTTKVSKFPLLIVLFT